MYIRGNWIGTDDDDDDNDDDDDDDTTHSKSFLLF